MNYRIPNPNGLTIRLTTDSPASHYGVPALRVDDDSTTDYGPADFVATAEHPAGVAAGELVAAWGLRGERTGAEREAARKFCAQWPEGPQVPAR